MEWWEVVLQNGGPVLVAPLPIVGAYLLNERSKRSAFKREKYDRKREAYEKALAALRDRRVNDRGSRHGSPVSERTDATKILEAGDKSGGRSGVLLMEARIGTPGSVWLVLW